MAKEYVYETSCVACNDRLDALNKMIEDAVDIKYGTMQRNCKGLDAWAWEHGYENNVKQGLTLNRDWHVSYHKSTFEGQPCYFMRWSAFEFIWVKDGAPAEN